MPSAWTHLLTHAHTYLCMHTLTHACTRHYLCTNSLYIYQRHSHTHTEPVCIHTHTEPHAHTRRVDAHTRRVSADPYCVFAHRLVCVCTQNRFSFSPSFENSVLFPLIPNADTGTRISTHGQTLHAHSASVCIRRVCVCVYTDGDCRRGN